MIDGRISFAGATHVGSNHAKVLDHETEQVDDELFTTQTAFHEARHLEPIEGLTESPNQSWRSKEKMKTLSVAVVMCLNVGVDPPDVVKPMPCAVMQCWIDPFASPTGLNSGKSHDAIAMQLIKQYERWQNRARYKHCVDPTIEDIKKLCQALRRNSKEERVLFHYNGHGVPKPTANGEIWVFNRNYTQYIPLSLYDLQSWMGSPSIYVFDCSNAGVVLDQFDFFAIQHQKEYEMNVNSSAFLSSTKENEILNSKIVPPPNYQSCILLAACNKDENLPFHPDFPADLFTSCLTTPIKTFFLWFIKRNSPKLAPDINIEIINQIPGNVSDRKTVLGELNWIFTAITDTIAWDTLPRDQFQRLFRQDLLVASLFRNFLLAQRIMRSFDCNPISNPRIKSTHNHPMWKAWDLVVDNCLTQLTKINKNLLTPESYVPSPFFAEQLTAFKFWLNSSAKPSNTPQQLPIVLQVLLSQVHRSRALDLLGNFLNLGPWAVNLALSVGIFPYVLKLLQASARELRPFLVFIWTKILAIDEVRLTFHCELIRDTAYKYFVMILSDSNISVDHQIMSSFVLSVLIRQNPEIQKVAVISNTNPYGSIIELILNLLMDPQYDNSNLRKWLLICLGNAWEKNENVRWYATRSAIYEKIYFFLDDPSPEVRTATVYALGTFINSLTQRNEHANEVDCRIASTLVQKSFYDYSPLVRKELLVTLQWFIAIFETAFLAVYRKRAFEDHTSKQRSPQELYQKGGGGTSEYSPKNTSALNQNSIPSIVANQSCAELSHCMNGHGSPTFSNMRKVSSRDRLYNFSSNVSKLLSVPVSIATTPSLNNAHHSTANLQQQITPPSSMKRVSSVSSLQNFGSSSGSFSPSCSGSTKTATSVFGRVWQMIELYRVDPHPEVVDMANLIYTDIESKAFIRALKEGRELAPSKPGSPNSREDNYMHRQESPSSESNLLESDSCDFNKSHTSTPAREAPKHHSGRVSVSGTSSPYLPASSNYNSFVTQYTAKRTIFGRDPNSEDMSEVHGRSRERNGLRDSRNFELSNSGSMSESRQPLERKSLVQTSFVDWSTKQFCEPCSYTNVNGSGGHLGNNSRNGSISEWRTMMLKKYYCKAKHDLERSNNLQNGNELIFQNKSVDANFVTFHPFDKYAVVADSYTFSALNYAKHDFGPLPKYRNDSSNQFSAKITSLQLIDTHDKALLMIGADNGSVKIWRDLLPTSFSSVCYDETVPAVAPKLSSAFFIFEDFVFRSGARSNNLVLRWNQARQRITAAGDHRFIRLWDSNKEMKIRDIVTGTDAITSLCIECGHLICAGCEDGVIRIFDDRQKSNAGQMLSFNNRNGPIVSVKMWPETYADSVNIVSGNKSGQVCWYDKRFTAKAVRVESMGSPMTAMNFHENADVFACAFGYDNSEVQLYTLDTLKGPNCKLRSRSVRHLSFHGLKSKFALLTNDGTLSIYKSSLHISS